MVDGPAGDHDVPAPGTEVSERLAVLVSYRGRDRVREILDVDDVTLDGLLDGSADWPQDAWENFRRALETLRSLGHAVETAAETELAGEGGPEGGDDASGAGEPDAGGPDLEEGDRNRGPEADRNARKPEAGGRPGQEAGPWRFWKARDLAIGRFFRGDVPVHRQIAALGVVIELEVSLMTLFREAPTEPGACWDGDRQDREVTRRWRLQAAVRRELHAMHSGVRGFRNRLSGRSRIDTGKLFQGLLADAAEAGPGYRPGLVDPLLPFSRGLHELVRQYAAWHYPRSDRMRG